MQGLEDPNSPVPGLTHTYRCKPRPKPGFPPPGTPQTPQSSRTERCLPRPPGAHPLLHHPGTTLRQPPALRLPRGVRSCHPAHPRTQAPTLLVLWTGGVDAGARHVEGARLAARPQSVSPSSGVPAPPARRLLPRAPDPPPRLEPPSCLIGVCGAENVAGHLGLGVVGLRLD